jgi:hypothetical protein
MEPRIAGSAAAKIMDRNAPAGDIRNLNYYRFVGAYQSELEGMPDKGKNLTTEQIQKIGDALLYQQVTTPAVKGQWIQGLNPFSTVPFRDQPAELGKPRFISAYDRLNADQREDIAKQLQKKRGENATITTLDIQVEAARQELERLMPGGPAPGAGPARRPGE